jgi:hypothetical protein
MPLKLAQLPIAGTYCARPHNAATMSRFGRPSKLQAPHSIHKIVDPRSIVRHDARLPAAFPQVVVL